MLVGRLLTIINFTLVGLVVAVYLFDQTIAELLLYVLIAWMFGSIILFYLPISQRRIGNGATPPPASASAGSGPAGPMTASRTSGRALLSTPSEPATLAFCIYCGLDLPPGVPVCPACGKAVRRI